MWWIQVVVCSYFCINLCTSNSCASESRRLAGTGKIPHFLSQQVLRCSVLTDGKKCADNLSVKISFPTLPLGIVGSTWSCCFSLVSASHHSWWVRLTCSEEPSRKYINMYSVILLFLQTKFHTCRLCLGESVGK